MACQTQGSTDKVYAEVKARPREIQGICEKSKECKKKRYRAKKRKKLSGV